MRTEGRLLGTMQFCAPQRAISQRSCPGAVVSINERRSKSRGDTHSVGGTAESIARYCVSPRNRQAACRIEGDTAGRVPPGPGRYASKGRWPIAGSAAV